MPRYLVGVQWEKTRITIEAKNGTEAKRIWCKKFERNPNDKWCGVSILSAKKIKEEN